MKKILSTTIIGVLLLTLGLVACTSAGPKEFSQEESQKIAEDFVKNEATFVYDGIKESLKLTDTAAVGAGAWQFTFTFDSRHSGYGDRTGQVLLQVITPHQAMLKVLQGKVTSAVMDEKWDMVKQTLIASAEGNTPVSVDAAYDGKQVEVRAGGLLRVTLESNASTGFKWELKAISDQSVVSLVDNQYITTASQNPPVVGAAGTEVWTFKALKAGTAAISMAYSRPWEGGEKGVETFNLTVVVK